MRTTILLGTTIAVIAMVLIGADQGPPPAAAQARVEYATLRWDGRDNTHVIRPGGNVEILGPKFAGIRKPERTDERSFFMNLAMNALGREGFRLVAMTEEDYVFSRSVQE